MLDCFNLSSVDNWKIKQKLGMLFCTGMGFTARISNVTPINNRFLDKHTTVGNMLLLTEIMGSHIIFFLKICVN
jgi:hypothetical protein